MIEILLDKQRHLRFNFNSLAWLEEALCEPGQPATSVLPAFFRQMAAKNFPGFRLQRALLWACLRHEDKTLTLEQAGELIAASQTAEIYEKCLTVMNEFFEEGNPRPLSEGLPGSSSGASAATISG